MMAGRKNFGALVRREREAKEIGLREMAKKNYEGAERVFGWSFYRQGSDGGAVSGDLFVSSALRWFGDTDPVDGGPWDRGVRLAKVVRARRTLLLLDGLELLQHPPGPQEGQRLPL